MIAEPATAPPPPARSVPASKLIHARLAALRTRHVGVALVAGLALTLAVAIELLALAMFLDWWLDLPLAVRTVLLLAQAGVLLFFLARFVAHPLLRQPNEEDLALMVERARPQFHSRLIASVQLTRPGAVPPQHSLALVDALVEQTETMTVPQDFRAIVPTDRMKTLALLALTVSVLGVGGLLYGRSTCVDLLQRAFLSNIPVPRKTKVIVLDGDKIIGRGDAVRLEAFAQGLVPAEGKVEIQYPNRRVQTYSLEQNKDNEAHFGRTIENVQDSFQYVVYLNDGLSPSYHVKAIPRPTVATIECSQEFPAYAGLPPTPRTMGDLTILAGSQLHLKVVATKALVSAAIRLVGPDTLVPMTMHPTNQFVASGSFAVPATGMNGFSIQLLDTENMESRDAAVYRLEILPDKPPVVRITSPDRKEELITREAVLPIGMVLDDDHAIAKVRLHYKVDTRDDGAEKEMELDLAGEKPKKMNRTFLWNIGQFDPPLTEGSLIEFWIAAQDNNDVTGPGLGQSEHQLGRVVSADEKRTELLNRASDFLGGIDDVAEDQEKANKTLGTLIHSVILKERKPE